MEPKKGLNYHRLGENFELEGRQHVAGTSPFVSTDHFLLQNLVAGTKLLSLQLVPQIQTNLNFWHNSLLPVPQNASCDDQSLRVN